MVRCRVCPYFERVNAFFLTFANFSPAAAGHFSYFRPWVRRYITTHVWVPAGFWVDGWPCSYELRAYTDPAGVAAVLTILYTKEQRKHLMHVPGDLSEQASGGPKPGDLSEQASGGPGKADEAASGCAGGACDTGVCGCRLLPSSSAAATAAAAAAAAAASAAGSRSLPMTPSAPLAGDVCLRSSAKADAGARMVCDGSPQTSDLGLNVPWGVPISSASAGPQSRLSEEEVRVWQLLSLTRAAVSIWQPLGRLLRQCLRGDRASVTGPVVYVHQKHEQAAALVCASAGLCGVAPHFRFFKFCGFPRKSSCMCLVLTAV